MTEDNLMFVYERVFYKLTSNPAPCRPPFFLVVKKKVKWMEKGPSARLKIAEQEACG